MDCLSLPRARLGTSINQPVLVTEFKALSEWTSQDFVFACKHMHIHFSFSVISRSGYGVWWFSKSIGVKICSRHFLQAVLVTVMLHSYCEEMVYIVHTYTLYAVHCSLHYKSMHAADDFIFHGCLFSKETTQLCVCVETSAVAFADWMSRCTPLGARWMMK